MPRLLQRVLPQLCLLGVVALMTILTSLDVLPPKEVLGERLQTLIVSHGIALVAVLSFVENLPGVNVYFPGSVVILTSMAATAGDPALAVSFFFSIAGPAIVANLISYRIGYANRGAGAGSASSKSGRNLWLWYLGTYWHPHFAAITAMASGAEGVPFRSYVSHFLPVSLGWVGFWSIVMYQTGASLLSEGGIVPLALAYIVAWLLWDLLKGVREERQGSS